jgi:hypothetical protein
MVGEVVLGGFLGLCLVGRVKIGLVRVILSLLFFLIGFTFGCILCMGYIDLAPFLVMVGLCVNSLFWWASCVSLLFWWVSV